MSQNVHSAAQRLEACLRRIKGETIEHDNGNVRDYSDTINPRNREFILRFLKRVRASVKSKTRILFYATKSWRLACIMREHLDDMTFADMDREAVDHMVGTLRTIDSNRGEPYSENSISDFLIVLKKLMQFRAGHGWHSQKYPEAVEDVKTTVDKDNGTMPEQLLDRNDIEDMASAAKNSRDVALVHVLYESAMRISEFLHMRIRDVQFDDYGALVTVPEGKTGRRKIRLVTSTSILAQWLKMHPNKDDSDAWIWCRLRGNEAERLPYDATRLHLKKLANRAGIEKPVNPHHFRHSRLTELANQLTEAQLCSFAGWVIGSDMARTYVHLSMRDMDDAILQANGIKKKDAREAAHTECARCEAVNQAVADTCHRCMLPLTDEAAQKVGETTTPSELKKEMARLLTDDDMWERAKELRGQLKEADQQA